MAAPCAFVSAPTEIVIRIFQYCSSFADLRALLLTCRRVHAVWIANSPSIIWDVAPKFIPAFDQALMAARATALVHAAYQDGLLFPEIRLDEISGVARKPSLSELRAVMDLHHLARCVEVRYCHVGLSRWYYQLNGEYERWPADRVAPPPLGAPEEPEGMCVWRERFHAAIYMSLLMGAVFCRAYSQPFYTDTTFPPDDELHRCRHRLLKLLRKAEASYGCSYFAYLWIPETEHEYLRRFPVFDLEDELGRQKEIFGPFIEWFIQSAIRQHRAEPPPSSRDPLRDEVKAARDFAASQGEDLDPPGFGWKGWPKTGTFSQWFAGSPAEGEAVLWLLMQSNHMFEFILTCIGNADGQRRLGRRYWKRVGSFSGKKTWTAKVVLFGIFQVEEILMPDDVMESADQQLLAHTPRSSTSPPILDIPLVLEDLYSRSHVPNTIASIINKAPPPPLQLFTFTLRHHFNLQFHTRAFDPHDRGQQDYHLFKNRATIFANGPEHVPSRERFDYTNGAEFLVECQPRTRTY